MLTIKTKMHIFLALNAFIILFYNDFMLEKLANERQ